MKHSQTILILSAVATLAAPAFGALGSSAPTVKIRATAAVSADTITLGDIAEITPSPAVSKASARLASTSIGRAPLSGASRSLTRGDVVLKLRQAGIDPLSVDLEGASDLTVTSTEGAGTQSPIHGSTAGTASAAQDRPAIRPGDPVDIVLDDGPVIVHSKGYAVTGGFVGDKIAVRRDGADHSLAATIIDAQHVALEE